MAKAGQNWSSKEHQAHKASHAPQVERGKYSVPYLGPISELDRQSQAGGKARPSLAEEGAAILASRRKK